MDPFALARQDHFALAGASFDQNQQAAVTIDLNGDGGRKMREATRAKVGKLMASGGGDIPGLAVASTAKGTI